MSVEIQIPEEMIPMPEPIDQREVIRLIRDRFCDECCTKGECDSCEYRYCIEAVEDVPTIPDIDRAAILRLCDDIGDGVTDIAFNSTHYHIRDCCEAIRKKLDEIRKELTGDAGSKTD